MNMKTQSKTPVTRPAKILVSTDFSDNARQAFPYAKSYAETFGSEVFLLHVIEKAGFNPKDVPLVLSDKQILQQSHEELKVLAAGEFSPPVRVQTLVRQGKAAEEIVAAAKEFNIDLIVIATRGRTGLKRALLGSTTELVMRQAECPVLVVRESE
jgi:universal stress protein A